VAADTTSGARAPGLAAPELAARPAADLPSLGAAAVVTFSWGRGRSVASEQRQRGAAARLVLVAAGLHLEGDPLAPRHYPAPLTTRN